MADYNFNSIEKKWQQYWKDQDIYKTPTDTDRPKFYVLDMFPYPSGAGLHVGHPLGYIATDITARYKRLKGYSVLHPMGFDSFGLPAEQYAIKSGQHPSVTTSENIKRFKEQLEVLGFSYDWEREVRTSDPDYYRWTQWIFLKLFNSYFDHQKQKARPIEELDIPNGLDEKEKQQFMDNQRLAYQAEVSVNWCPALGTVLANEEVIGGVSERGGYPVIRKPMRQWMLRITTYADRLLDSLTDLDWPESIKASQRNWIGKSYGAEIDFKEKSIGATIKVFTTRPDTIFGVTYMVLAPEHPLVQEITTEAQKSKVESYLDQASRKSDLERTELEKTKTGVFTGAYAINPINKEEIPIWISDYVLISYGTGAVMAVPGGDQRDFEFADKFNLEIRQVITPDGKPIEPLEESYPGQGIMLNSEEYNGMKSEAFFKKIVDRLEKEDHGKATENYKLRDWVFTRQRYWGEPIPVLHLPNGTIVSVPEEELPVELPEVTSYEPSQDGESPLAKVSNWVNIDHPKYGPAKRETNTMPQWAGSCWYYLRYLDPHNQTAIADPDLIKQWSPVDLYVGGAEHAVLHLLYARFWHKVLFDLGFVATDEPFQKLVNQGMIQGISSFAYRIKDTNKFVSFNLRDEYKTTPIHVDIDLVRQNVLDIERFKKWHPDLANAEFILEGDKYICGSEVEKMSKSKLNVVNPDEIIARYGADTLRLYEMFLGPVEQPKPWNTHGIEGVYKFLRKFWRLFHDPEGKFSVTDEAATPEELKYTHQTIKKVAEDIERFSFNTAVSTMMICVNELTTLKCNKRAVLHDLVMVLSPFAPHMAEELWQLLGESESITLAKYPEYREEHITEDQFEYPVSVNGKMRTKMSFALDLDHQKIEEEVLSSEVIQKWLDGKTPKKVIIVPKKIVNVVV